MVGFRQIGLIVGPGLNLFLRRLDYKLGPFVLDKHTSPGVQLEFFLQLFGDIPIGIDDRDMDNFGGNIFVLLL